MDVLPKREVLIMKVKVALYTILHYVINSVLRSFWLALNCDFFFILIYYFFLLKDRGKDDDSARLKQVWQLCDFSEPIRMRWFATQPMTLFRFV